MAKLPVLRLLALAALLVSGPALAAMPAPSVEPLSFAGMFLNADWVVKLVIAGLLCASVATWTVLIAKQAELRRADAASRAMREVVSQARGLESLKGNPQAASPLLEAALLELRLSGDALHDSDGVKERIATRLSRIEAQTAKGLTRGITLLATIGATAPFVGLFGTVWGIMHSFMGIAEKHTTNLAVVAPGIAEALLATAVGLVAAIPAVVIYNHLARAVASHRGILGDVEAAILNLVSRDLSRGVAARSAVPMQLAE